MNRDRAWLFTHGNETLDSGTQQLFEEIIARRSRREPLQYITGRQEFWGLDFFVAPGVLIPRPETELIVETAIKTARTAAGPLAIIDLCTGSGCIAVSLAREIKNSRIFATDSSSQALDIARENARKQEVSNQVRFLEGDLFEPLDELDLRGKTDIITANPPYIEAGDLPGLQPEVRDYEPEMALIAGPEGTEIQQRILEQAPEYLKKQSVLVMEMGMGQSEKLKRLAAATGAYIGIEILKDLAGIDRVIVAHKK